MPGAVAEGSADPRTMSRRAAGGDGKQMGKTTFPLDGLYLPQSDVDGRAAGKASAAGNCFRKRNLACLAEGEGFEPSSRLYDD